MSIRASAVVFPIVLLVSACRSGQAGPSFSSSSLLAPSSDAEAAHDELLRADLGRADSVGRLGIAAGLASNFSSDVVYLRGGLPIMRSRAASQMVIAAESIGAPTAVKWQPVRAEASRDGKSGYSYGYSIYSQAQSSAPTIRVDRYIAYWRREAGGWKIAAYAETYGTPPPPLTIPPAALDSIAADIPMSRRRGVIDELRLADEAFSRDAGRLGTGEAFGRYAAPDAQMFSPPGEFITGPVAITGSFGAPVKGSALAWHPVEGEAAGSGDLGFTVGNAVFTGEREDGAPVIRYSKYLTVWKRQKDGTWRFVVDGGSERPAR